MKNKLPQWYRALVLDKPVITLTVTLLLLVFLGYHVPDFKLDASSDSLVLENDRDLKYYQSIRARYGSDDFLIITYKPQTDLFAAQSLDRIRQMREELKQIERVESVTTMLDVPLIDSPRTSLSRLQKEVRTLETPDTDIELAKQEFLTSPLYRNLVLSADGKTTAIQVNFKRDELYLDLLNRRDTLREKQLQEDLSPEEERELKAVSDQFKQYSSTLQDQEQEDIAQVRRILDGYRDNAEIHLGGVPMIVSDMIDYIQYDISVFGVAVLAFLILLLAIFFHKPRWIFLPMLVCFAAGIGMIGFLGLVDWRVTVVSSNFISLLLIITLSLMVHLAVRYREIQALNPQASQEQLLWDTVRSKVKPAFFTAITTIVAFGSLLVSDIRPIIDFGWMMVFGISLGFVLAFIMFPCILIFLKPGDFKVRHDYTGAITGFFARLIHRFRNTVLASYAVLFVLSLIGMSFLSVENRFIDYFKQSTEIYQGMVTIDNELGGTTPLDVILEPDKAYYEFLQEFGADEEAAGISGTSFWFNTFQLEEVEQIHDYLETLPETGKVLSMATTMKMLAQLNNDEPLDNITLAVMYKRLPPTIKDSLFDPYMSADGNQVRFGIRVFESDVGLKRQQLLDTIRADLQEKFGLEKDQIRLTGMVVLYNNLLQSLFKSQILTLGVVLIAIMFMFMILFRSVKISLIAIVPNLVASAFVLGLMGWLGIRLDIMTITIAAITIGIAVDDTIHYTHRFLEEYPKDRDAWAAVKRCHGSIGRAMYYTSITITLGFSILVLSNFMPTIYFGLLTGCAMVIALLADIMLLPILLMIFKPEPARA